MNSLLTVFLILLLLFFLYLFLIAPRRGQEGLSFFRNYRYAHRGLHNLPDSVPCVPENSLAAFRLAAAQGFGAELDVHFTKDRRLAVVHDSDLARVTGRNVRVEDLTSEELKGLRLFHTEERIPFLEEVLPLFEASGTPLIVEIKPAGKNSRELTADTAACLQAHQVPFCIESFDPHVLLYLKKSCPAIIRGQLSMNYKGNGSVSALNAFLLTNLIYNFLTRPDFIAYHFPARKNLSCLLCSTLLKGAEADWTIRSMTDLVQAEKENHLVIFENFLPQPRAKS